MNKTAIVIGAVLTTMILLSVAGITYAARAAASTSAAPAGEQALPADREAAYQAQIEEANRRLIEAQATQQALEAQINALQGAPQNQGGEEWMYEDDEHGRGGGDDYDDHEGEHREVEHKLFGWFGEGEDD